MRKHVALCLAAFLACGAMAVSANGQAAPPLIVNLELLDAGGNPLLDYTSPGGGGADGIQDVERGTPFKLRATVACSAPAGIAGGTMDVTGTPQNAGQDLADLLTINSFAVNPALPASLTPPPGEIQPGPPQYLDEIGKGIFIFSPGFGYPGPVEWFTSDMVSGTEGGFVDFEAVPGSAGFAVSGVGNVSFDATKSLYVVPEPASLSLMVLTGGALFARRMRRRKR